MHASDSIVSTKPCSSCGAYRGSDHQFSCQPGRHITPGRFRHAERDARNSAAILANDGIQELMISGLVQAERAQRAQRAGRPERQLATNARI